MKVLLLSSFFLITGVFPQEVDKIQNIRGFDKIPPFVINGLKKAGLTTVCELEVALENVGGNIADLDVPSRCFIIYISSLKTINLQYIASNYYRICDCERRCHFDEFGRLHEAERRLVSRFDRRRIEGGFG